MPRRPKIAPPPQGWRNEAMQLRDLLAAACRILDQYGTLDAAPDRVRRWWVAQKTIVAADKVRASEFGVLQTMLQDEEQREDDLDVHE